MNLNEPVTESTNVKKHSLPVGIENFKSDSSRLMCLNTHIPNTIDLWAKMNLFFTAISANSIISAFVLDPIIFTFCISDQIFAVDIFAVKLNEDGKLDITTEPEGLDVLSINDGEVVFVGEQFKNYDKEDFHMEKRYGNVIVIYHGGCYSIYAHLKEKSIKVKTGDIVKKGEVIAKMGHTGNSACNEPHLHFEMTYTNLTPKSGWKSLFTFEIPKQREGFEDYECTDIGIRTGASLWYDIIGDKEEIINKFNEKMEICKSGELSGCCFLSNPPKKAIRESIEELENSFYFYHMVPAGTNVSRGLLSPHALVKFGMHKEAGNALSKYRNRMVDGWNVYPNRKAEELTEDELINGLEKFRGEGGSREIYFFKYPPTAELGRNMADILKEKDIYRIDLNNKDIMKYIDRIDWGYVDACRDNKPYDRKFYEDITTEEYFSKYNDDGDKDKPLFATIPHIGIVFKYGICPNEFITMISKNGEMITESCNTLYEYEIAYEKLMTKVDYKNTEIKNFDHFCNLCKTPEDTMKWFITNKVSWRNHDNKDKIYWPNDVINRKQGNCWDQAVLMHLYFKKKNIEHRMNLFSIVMEDGKRAGHIYPTFKRGNYIYIWAYLGVGVGFITGPYRDWYEAARMFTDFYKVLLLSDNSFNSVISDETEWSVQDYKETCRIDKRVGENISQQDYMLEDGGDNIWSTHFFSNDFRYIRIPKTKAILYKVYWWAKKHSEKNQDEPMKNESEIKPIKEEYSLSDLISSKESTEIIRPTDEDLKAIEYIKESFTDEEKEWFGNNNSDTPDNNPENIAFIKVSYENGRPSGYVELTDSGKLGLAEGDVNLSFAVHKDFRGKGIAKQLIKEAVHWFKESDFTTMSFIVRKGNTASYNLAEKCGFVHMSYWEKTKEDWFMITNPTMLQAIGESSTETEQEVKSPMGICDSVIDYLGSSLDIEKFSDLKSGKRFMYTRCTVMKKDIPLILFLSYCEGLTTVLRKAGVRFMFSDTRPRLKGMDAVNKGVIPFSDGYIIYDKYPLEVSLLMNGLGIIDTKVLAYSEMDGKDVYVNIFETVFGSRILANALDNFYECMIDPVTYTILEELNYPTEFVGLLLAGNKLLADNNFRDELDMANYRIRSNEMAYAYAYKQVATAYSKFRMTANNKNPNKISIPQSVVLKDIMQSQVVEDVSELSPIVEVEKSHILTDKGPSGTNLKEAYNIRRRCFHPSMTGIVAMSQSPDANVGINRAMTMNPNVINARGIVPPNDEKDMDEVNLYGVAELLTPGSMSHDDPTRGSMSVKQAKHIVPVEAASPVLVSNGSEKVLPYHLSSDFVIVAKDDGKVISRDEKTGVAVIEYKNRQGKAKHQVINMNSKVVKNGAGGFYLVNTMNCDKLKKGSTFKKNDILAYNENFFSSSEAEGVRFNIGVLSKVACVSTYISFEDGDFVTDKLSKKLGTDVCMESTAIVGKNSNVSYIVKKGQEVNVNDPLIIYDDSTDDVAFNKMLANIGKDLKEEITRLGKVPVKSKYSGIIEDIKVYTTVEPKSMSPSLRKIVEEHFSKLKAQDAEIMKQTKDGGEEGFAFTEHAEIIDGGEDGKIMGVKVGEGVYFRFFIKYKDYLDVGDKLVHFTAMKYVNAEVVPKGEEPFSLNNPDEEISSIFAPGGVMARMTPSIFKTMYENKVIIELKRKWLEMYQKDNPSFKPKDELY
jgi:RimJ/RimL family protein N-acetyltransferase